MLGRKRHVLTDTLGIGSSRWSTVHPPWAKPPVGSSDGPPGARIAPSKLTNAAATAFLASGLP